MRHTRIMIPVLVMLVGLSLTVSGCGSSDKNTRVEDQPVETLYNRAAAALDKKDFVQAAKLFQEVERQHPYSEWATRAELMASYSYYEAGRYDEAIIGLDRFVQLHPGYKDIDYALYLKALCFYEQISDVTRDQFMTREALANFETLINRYPDSLYTRDAILKRDLTLDHLAGKEMEIGRYYLNRGEVNAALNRFRSVIKDYQTTTHIPEALHRMSEAYITLGLKDSAYRVAAVLGHNYPGSEWYQRSFALMDPEQRAQLKSSQSFIDRTVNSLLKPD
jgi:outer membrane protein assembly factor BamD